jgi:hypothetical protein
VLIDAGLVSAAFVLVAGGGAIARRPVVTGSRARVGRR